MSQILQKLLMSRSRGSVGRKLRYYRHLLNFSDLQPLFGTKHGNDDGNVDAPERNTIVSA